MTHDDRADKSETPIPTVHLASVERELQEFLHGEARERAAGYTVRAVVDSIKTLQTAFLVHIEEDHKYHRETDQKIRTLDRRMGTAESWIEEHNAIDHERPSSVPPLRDAMDTGAFKMNLHELEIALETERERFRAYEKSKLSEELVELKASRTWWSKNLMQWVIAAVGGFAAIVITAFVAWVVGKGAK